MVLLLCSMRRSDSTALSEEVRKLDGILPENFDRRTFLLGTASLTLGEFAGCLGNSDAPANAAGTDELPAAILAPIFVLWFDSYIVAASVFVAWVSFFPILINTITGFSHVRQELYHLGDVFGATPSQFVRKIEFWEALPYSASGLKVAVQQAIVGAIVIEFIATTGGLGYLIVNALELLRQGLLFGVLIVIICFAVVFYNLTAWLISSLTPPLPDQ